MEQQEEELERYLLQLIERMNMKEEVCSSDESVSVQAYREAEKSGKLKDERVYPVLKKLILEHNRKKDKQFRREAYFIWGNLLQYIPQKEYIQFYLGQMEKETDKYMVSAMLERIAEMEKIDMPKDLNIDVVIKMSKNEKWQIRHSAIRALRTFDREESRQALRAYIGQTDEKKYKYEIIYAHSSLGKTGTINDIAILEKHIKSRSRDIRDSAKFAIDSIKERKNSNKRKQ